MSPNDDSLYYSYVFMNIRNINNNDGLFFTLSIKARLKNIKNYSNTSYKLTQTDLNRLIKLIINAKKIIQQYNN